MKTKIYRFTASWCAPCALLAKALEKAKLDADIEVIDVDVHPDMVLDYGIRSVPALIEVGSNKKPLVGLKSTEEIIEWFES